MLKLPAGISVFCLVFVDSAISQTAGSDTLSAFPGSGSTPSLTGIIIKLLLSMILIVGLIYFSMYLVKKLNSRAMGGGMIGDTIKIIGRTFLSPKQALYVVKIGQRYAILGATENNINMISELSQQEAEQFKNKDLASAGTPGQKFADIFKGFLKQ